MSDLKTVGDLCEALANPTPAKVQRQLRLFDLDHEVDEADVLTPTLRARKVWIPGGMGGMQYSVEPDVPAGWLVVGGDMGGYDWGNGPGPRWT